MSMKALPPIQIPSRNAAKRRKCICGIVPRSGIGILACTSGKDFSPLRRGDAEKSIFRSLRVSAPRGEKFIDGSRPHRVTLRHPASNLTEEGTLSDNKWESSSPMQSPGIHGELPRTNHASEGLEDLMAR